VAVNCGRRSVAEEVWQKKCGRRSVAEEVWQKKVWQNKSAVPSGPNTLLLTSSHSHGKPGTHRVSGEQYGGLAHAPNAPFSRRLRGFSRMAPRSVAAAESSGRQRGLVPANEPRCCNIGCRYPCAYACSQVLVLRRMHELVSGSWRANA
jgi:hypothetical protein